jgi:hypothetical protein
MTATLNGKRRTNGRRRSAYPATVEELVPKARRLAAELGELPSQNRLKSTLRIGADKAAAVRRALEHGGLNGHGPIENGSPGEHAGPDTQVQAETTQATVPAVASHSSPPDASAQALPRTGLVAEPAPQSPPSDARPGRRVRSWPVVLLALPAFISIWSGWVGLGALTGFGVVHPLPGIWDSLTLDTAITLPIGVETYAAYALRVWLSGSVPRKARRFAACSAIGSLALGAAGQVAYHLMTAAQMTAAPWPITTAVACLPVAVLGMGAALAHLIHATDNSNDDTDGGAR